MNIFIAIILIAELIIMFGIIGVICYIDFKVVALTKKIDDMRPKLQERLINIKDGVIKSTSKIKKFCDTIRGLREKFLFSIFQSFVIYLLMFSISKKRKRYMATFRLLCALRDCWACN